MDRREQEGKNMIVPDHESGDGTVSPAFFRNTEMQFRNDFCRGSNIVFILLSFMAFTVVFSLFAVKVDVGVRAAGLLKPETDRIVVSSPASGRLVMCGGAGENVYFTAGDTLFRVFDERTAVEMNALDILESEVSGHIHDLEVMLAEGRDAEERDFVLSSHFMDYTYFRTKVSEMQYSVDMYRRDYDRRKILLEDNMISDVDFEESESSLRNAELAMKTYIDGVKAGWASDLVRYRTERSDIYAKKASLDAAERESVILAPSDGTLLKLHNVNDGVFVHSGQSIADFSPEGKLMAECLVKTQDAGFLKEGMKCRFVVDAFDYNEGGAVEGYVMKVFDDITTDLNGNSGYRVFCSLDKSVLFLKNGTEGRLKKGMSFTVRFIVARRSLFNLLFDRLDDWMNPLKG